ncbi:unnamed protein product, partial [Rotaria socialis]
AVDKTSSLTSSTDVDKAVSDSVGADTSFFGDAAGGATLVADSFVNTEVDSSLLDLSTESDPPDAAIDSSAGLSLLDDSPS